MTLFTPGIVLCFLLGANDLQHVLPPSNVSSCLLPTRAMAHGNVQYTIRVVPLFFLFLLIFFSLPRSFSFRPTQSYQKKTQGVASARDPPGAAICESITYLWASGTGKKQISGKSELEITLELLRCKGRILPRLRAPRSNDLTLRNLNFPFFFRSVRKY